MERVVAALFFLLFFCSRLFAAELWLREALVKKHSRDVLVTVRVTPGPVGGRPRRIRKGCDFRVALRSNNIKVPIVGRITNACSHPDGVGPNYWSRKLKPLERRTVRAEGVLRVWFEDPPQGPQRQCECDPQPASAGPRPAHMVELYPLIRLGSTSFLDMTGEIRKGRTPLVGYLGGRLSSTLERKRIAVRRVRVAGEPYIAIRGSKIGYSHWTLLADVMSVAERRPGGHAFLVAVKKRDGYLERNLRALTIEGTPADKGVERVEVNDELILFGIVRLDLVRIARAAAWSWRRIRLPYELVVLDIMR